MLVSDEAAAGSDLVATSAVLAKALDREGADLVLFGQQSSDSDGAVLCAAGSRSGCDCRSSRRCRDSRSRTGAVDAKRQTEFGYDHVAALLPVVVAVSDAINEPRYPSLKGIMGAKSKPQESLTVADLGLGSGDVGEGGSRTEVRGLGSPPRAVRR